MSNTWDQQLPQQPDPNQPVYINAPSRNGSLLHEYRQQQPNSVQQSLPPSPQQQPPMSAQPPQYSPLSPTQAGTGQSYNPYSPLPPGPQPGQHPSMPPGPQPQPGPHPSMPLGPQAPRPWPQGLQPFANSWQMVKQWSGKMMATHRAGYEAPLPPMQTYRPQVNNSLQPGQAPSPTVPGQGGPPARSSRPLRLIQRRQRRQNPRRKRIIIGVLVGILCFLIILLSSGAAYAYNYYQSQLPTLQKLANQQIPQTSRIYDRNGTLLYNAYSDGGRRTYVSYQYIPQVMDYAMTSAEDPTFWTNNGIDFNGITRAAFQYATTHHIQSGGSTITQQLIKNLRNDAQDTLQRKISEATLAIGLTQQYPKWKILEMYLNVSPFGSQDLGVEAAVEEYFKLQPVCNTDFNKGVFSCVPGIALLDCPQISSCNNPSQVYLDKNGNVVKKYKPDPMMALARASLLAGLPQSPVSYDPTLGKYNRSLALARQDYVLHQMMKYGQPVQGIGKLTPAIIAQAEALTAKMTFTPFTQKIIAPGFVNWVIPQIEDALGNGNETLGTEMFITGGFNIRTTVDAKIEQYVEAAVTRHLTQPEYQYFTGQDGPLNTENNVNDAAVVVMDAKTGEIIAMDGSSNYYSTDPRIEGQYNVATDGLGRQPGSTFKIFDYVTAFEMGWYPGIILTDAKTYFPNGGGSDIANAYTPSDYSQYGVAGTNVSIRTATADSLNVPAIKAVEFAGVNNVINTARRFGVTAIDADLAAANRQRAAQKLPPETMDQFIGPALALGSTDIPLIQMVGAYQVLANQGVRIPPHSVLDIWDNYGHHLYHYDPTHPNGTQVISPQIAYLMTNVLADENARAVEFWPDHVLSFWDMDPTHTTWQVAAKTGTTSDATNTNILDNVTLGYTPDVVVGVWVGNANNEPMTNHTIGITGAAPIWHSVIENLVGQCNYDYTTSTAPDGIPCTDMQDVQALHYTDKQFPVPPGVGQYPTNTYNGLMGSGNIDWMLDNEQPQQSGVAPVTTTCTNNQGNNNNNGGQGCTPTNNGGGNGNGGGNPPTGGPPQTPGGGNGKGNGGGHQGG